MDSTLLTIETGDHRIVDLTADVRRFCAGRGDGLCNVFAPHATAGVAVMETGSGSEADLAEAIERLLPTQDVYRHRHGTLGHGRDHVLPVFVAPSMVVPVLGGLPALGTWQRIVLIDSNGDNPVRTVRLSFLASG